MWAVEKDPALRSDFCNLTVLEHAPDPQRLRAKIADALVAIPRLAQRVVSAPLRLAAPEWVDDPDLDLDYHIRHVALPAPGEMRDLLDLVATLAESPFDRGRPLWEFTVIEGLSGGRAAMLQKMHHTITDGVGGLKLSLALVDLEPGADRDFAAPPAAVVSGEDLPGTDSPGTDRPHRQPARSAISASIDGTRHAVRDAAAKQLQFAKQTVEGAAHLATHPLEVPEAIGDAARLAGSVRRQVLVTEAAHSDLFTTRSLRRHFEVIAVPLDDLSATARALGGSINDVFVTAIAGGLGAYHAQLGSEVADLRMAMAVSTRERGDSTPNRFAPSRVVIPIAPPDVLPRFAATRAALDSAKHERAFQSLDRLAVLASGMPTSILVVFTRAQTRTIDFATSNMRGSPVPLYLAGARIEANYPLGPRTGCAVNATMLSYCNECHVGINIDPASVTDIPRLMEAIRASFTAVIATAADITSTRA